MSRSVRLLATLTLCVLAIGVAAVADDKIGAGVTLTTATPIKDLYEQPEKFLGKAIRVDGVAAAVCEEMGCWMTIAAPDKPLQTVRFKIDHEGGMAFPATAKGKQVSAEGVFSKIATGDKEGNEAARESGAKPADFGATYQVKLTGAVIK
jgi:hypothetical protein